MAPLLAKHFQDSVNLCIYNYVLRIGDSFFFKKLIDLTVLQTFHMDFHMDKHIVFHEHILINAIMKAYMEFRGIETESTMLSD